MLVGLLAVAGCTSPVPASTPDVDPSPSASSSASASASDSGTSRPEPSGPSATPEQEPPGSTSPAPSAPPQSSSPPSPEGPEDPAGPTSPDVTAGAGVTVVVSWSGTSSTGGLQASGYAQVIEQGGVCVLETTAEDGTVARTQTEAIADASTTTCGELTVPASEAGPGPWTALLRYESSTSRGASDAFVIGAP